VYSLHLHRRLVDGADWECDLTRWINDSWRRTIRSTGGFWSADFVISGVSQFKLQQLYSTMIGKRVVETSYGRITWEGEIVELTLTLNGVTYTQSLDTELWHNKVKTQYTYPSAQDVQQGVLAYVSPGGDPGFQDTLQDFSEWETVGAGESVYQIEITNNDGTSCSGYLGEATTTLNADDSIWIFRDRGRGIAGINGTTVAKTPISYIVSDIDNAGTQQETAWSENQASSDIYGESQYIEVLAEECYLAAAEAVRDRRLVDYAYPRSIPSGGLSSDEPQSGGDQLAVTCSGYVFSMNRRFYETNVMPLDVSVQLRTLIAASEYVTDGGILDNTSIKSPLTGATMTFRLWDEIEHLISLGNTSGARYVGGVDTGRLFRYDLAETTMLYEWRQGQLRYITGQLVPPTLIVPNIIVRLEAPLVVPAPGATFQSPVQSYITEVEFIAPRSYRLVPADGDILAGSY